MPIKEIKTYEYICDFCGKTVVTQQGSPNFNAKSETQGWGKRLDGFPLDAGPNYKLACDECMPAWCKG